MSTPPPPFTTFHHSAVPTVPSLNRTRALILSHEVRGGIRLVLLRQLTLLNAAGWLDNGHRSLSHCHFCIVDFRILSASPSRLIISLLLVPFETFPCSLFLGLFFCPANHGQLPHCDIANPGKWSTRRDKYKHFSLPLRSARGSNTCCQHALFKMHVPGSWLPTFPSCSLARFHSRAYPTTCHKSSHQQTPFTTTHTHLWSPRLIWHLHCLHIFPFRTSMLH